MIGADLAVLFCWVMFLFLDGSSNRVEASTDLEVIPCLLLGWIGLSRDTVYLYRMDMIGEYHHWSSTHLLLRM